MLKERCSHAMIYHQDDIFAIGGHSNNTAEKYSIVEKRWEKLPDMNCKEKQVSTLFIFNAKYLVCIFGYVNNDYENDDYIEMLDLTNSFDFINRKWDSYKISHNLATKYDLKLFNVGIIPINLNQFIVCGGEHFQGEETDNVYMLDMSDIKNIKISNIKETKLPIRCSFIDKNFIRYTALKFAQYEMKKNNLILFNSVKCKFKLKSF